MSANCLLFPAELLDALDDRGWPWGLLNLRIDSDQGVITVAQAWNHGQEEVQRLDGLWQETRHYLRYADVRPFTGVWYRCDPDLHEVHRQIRSRVDAAIPVDEFRKMVQGWTEPGQHNMLVATVTTPAMGRPAVSAWRMQGGYAVPELASLVDGRLAPLDLIREEWPVEQLQRARVTIIGLGSIGSTAAVALARSGIGSLALVDYDRLEGSAQGLVDISYARRCFARRMFRCPRSSHRSSSVMSWRSPGALTRP